MFNGTALGFAVSSHHITEHFPYQLRAHTISTVREIIAGQHLHRSRDLFLDNQHQIPRQLRCTQEERKNGYIIAAITQLADVNAYCTGEIDIIPDMNT